MKKIILSLLMVSTLGVFAQFTAKDVFSSKTIVWYGLNFSEAKMVGQFDQAMGAGPASGSDIKNKWIPQWNSLIMTEQKNFKIKEAFQKDEVFYDITPTEKQNQNINSDDLMSFNTYTFKDAQKTAKEIVSKLKGGEKTEGIGVTFIVESFNKSMDEAVVYVTVFDIKTKNILILERMVGKPMGIGLRNFWAGAMKHVIKQITTDYYNLWKSKAK
ncbi:MAG TPA: hypothetical protein PKZ75_02980 [Bacteroidia bacterium]|nr:hypothetical protein [Bacteroidia bacterium]